MRSQKTGVGLGLCSFRTTYRDCVVILSCRYEPGLARVAQSKPVNVRATCDARGKKFYWCPVARAVISKNVSGRQDLNDLLRRKPAQAARPPPVSGKFDGKISPRRCEGRYPLVTIQSAARSDFE